MNTTQIKCFISLGKTLNFTQTAKELFLAQPTVSKNIDNLENEVGFKLIVHNHRRIELTDTGKYFYKELSRINNELTHAVQSAQSMDKIGSHTITIGYSNIPFEKDFLPIFIQSMNRKNHYYINLKNINLSDPFIKENLDNKKIDFMLYQADFFQENKYEFIPMMQAGFSVIIRKDSLLRKYRRIPLDALCNQKIFLWDGKDPLESVSKLKNVLSKKHITIGSNLRIINKVSLATILVQAGDGIAIVPSFVYDHSNIDVYYRYLDWKNPIKYGISYLKETKNKTYYRDLIYNLQKAINITKEKWNN
jgi:DNA-binding transcriptional LysR family regulator